MYLFLNVHICVLSCYSMTARYLAPFSGTLLPSRGKQKSSETKPTSRVSRPEKPISKPSFSVLGPKQARARSAPPPAKRISEKPVHPPFLAYGYRDKEREIGAKKTHNILASAEVIAFIVWIMINTNPFTTGHQPNTSRSRKKLAPGRWTHECRYPFLSF